MAPDFPQPHWALARAYWAESKINFFLVIKEYLNGYLHTTNQITAGPQPVIAYLLLKENEIRTLRLILTAKKNNLNTKLILDRLGE